MQSTSTHSTTPTPRRSAYHGDPAIKAKYVDRMKAHIAEDQLVQGVGFDAETRSGCAIGCTLDRYCHEGFADELGVPLALAKLYDRIYEGLPVPENQAFALGLLAAIPVGADLEAALTIPRFLHWLLTTDDPRVNLARRADERGKAAIRGVAELYRRWIDGDKPGEDEWRAAAWSAAWAEGTWADGTEQAASWSAAWSARTAARAADGTEQAASWSAAWSARTAARAAEGTERAASWSAEAAAVAAEGTERAAEAAEAAGRSDAYRAMASKLLELVFLA